MFVQSPFYLQNLTERNYAQLMLETFLKYGERMALIDSATGWSCTYKEAYEYTYVIKNYLVSLGIKPGQRMAMLSLNCPEVILTQLACGLLNDMTLIHVSPLATPDELARDLKLAECEQIITQKDFVSKIQTVAQRLPNTPHVHLLPDQNVLLNKENLAAARSEIPLQPFARGDFKMVFFSSGTTGAPKALEVPTKCFSVAVAQNSAAPWWRPADNAQQTANEIHPERSLAVLPLTHIYATTTVATALYKGHLVVTMPRFYQTHFLDNLQKYKITYTHLVPPLVKFLAEHPDVDRYDLSNLHSITCASAPLQPQLAHACKKRLRLKDMRQLYGMTELRNSTWTPYGYDNFASIGVPLPNSMIKIVNIDGGTIICRPYEKGELWVSGPQIGGRYFKNDSATKDTFVTVDGVEWCRTGDVGHFDEHGYIYLTERHKDLIKYKGLQVSPAEIEAVLNEHPAVAECAVVGKPDPEAGELPAAFIVPKDGKQLSAEEIKIFVKERLSTYKQLAGGVIFLKELPRLQTGKLQKSILRDMLNAKNSKL